MDIEIKIEKHETENDEIEIVPIEFKLEPLDEELGPKSPIPDELGKPAADTRVRKAPLPVDYYLENPDYRIKGHGKVSGTQKQSEKLKDEVKCSKPKAKSCEVIQNLKFIKCNICQFQFDEVTYLKHGCKEIKQRMHCGVCGFQYKEKWQLEQHFNKSSGRCPIPPSRTALKCDQCDFTALYPHRLAAHTVKHGEKKFKCEQCDYRAHTLTQIRSHTNVVHNGERKYECDVCGLAFSYGHSLRIHVMSQHTGEKPFKCDLCEKAFITKASLKSHIWTHTGEKPYKCDLCNYTTRDRGAVKKHKRSKHPENANPVQKKYKNNPKYKNSQTLKPSIVKSEPSSVPESVQLLESSH